MSGGAAVTHSHASGAGAARGSAGAPRRGAPHHVIAVHVHKHRVGGVQVCGVVRRLSDGLGDEVAAAVHESKVRRAARGRVYKAPDAGVLFVVRPKLPGRRGARHPLAPAAPCPGALPSGAAARPALTCGSSSEQGGTPAPGARSLDASSTAMLQMAEAPSPGGQLLHLLPSAGQRGARAAAAGGWGGRSKAPHAGTRQAGRRRTLQLHHRGGASRQERHDEGGGCQHQQGNQQQDPPGHGPAPAGAHAYALSGSSSETQQLGSGDRGRRERGALPGHAVPPAHSSSLLPSEATSAADAAAQHATQQCTGCAVAGCRVKGI